MELSLIFNIIGFVIWIISILWYFRAAVPESNLLTIIIFGYSFFAYFIFFLKCVFNILSSENLSDPILYTDISFALTNFLVSGYFVLRAIDRNDFIESFNHLTQLSLASSWLISLIIFILVLSNKTVRNFTFTRGIQIIIIIDIIIYYIIIRKYIIQGLEIYYLNINNEIQDRLFFYLEFFASSCWLISIILISKQDYVYLFENFSKVSIIVSAFIYSLCLIFGDLIDRLKKNKGFRRKTYNIDYFEKQCTSERSNNEELERDRIALPISELIDFSIYEKNYFDKTASPPPSDLNEKIWYLWGLDHPSTEGFWNRMNNYVNDRMDDLDVRSKYIAFTESLIPLYQKEKFFRVTYN